MFKVGPLNKGFKGIKVVVEHIEDTDGILGYSLLFCNSLFLCGGLGDYHPCVGGGEGEDYHSHNILIFLKTCHCLLTRVAKHCGRYIYENAAYT